MKLICSASSKSVIPSQVQPASVGQPDVQTHWPTQAPTRSGSNEGNKIVKKFQNL
jgi:hypothetical protein